MQWVIYGNTFICWNLDEHENKKHTKKRPPPFLWLAWQCGQTETNLLNEHAQHENSSIHLNRKPTLMFDHKNTGVPPFPIVPKQSSGSRVWMFILKYRTLVAEIAEIKNWIWLWLVWEVCLNAPTYEMRPPQVHPCQEAGDHWWFSFRGPDTQHCPAICEQLKVWGRYMLKIPIPICRLLELNLSQKGAIFLSFFFFFSFFLFSPLFSTYFYFFQ